MQNGLQTALHSYMHIRGVAGGLGWVRRQAKQGLEQGSKRSTHMDHLIDRLVHGPTLLE